MLLVDLLVFDALQPIFEKEGFGGDRHLVENLTSLPVVGHNPVDSRQALAAHGGNLADARAVHLVLVQDVDSIERHDTLSMDNLPFVLRCGAGQIVRLLRCVIGIFRSFLGGFQDSRVHDIVLFLNRVGVFSFGIYFLVI